jgi:hypothetical protein
MTRMLQVAAKLALILLVSAPAFPQPRVDEIGQAFNRLYNFDFPDAQAILSKSIAAAPDDPLPYAVRASAYLFSELDRLSILESEFFSDDSRIIDKKKVKPDPLIKVQLFRAVEDAQSRAQAILGKNPNDQDALFSMCITTGVLTDYTALVEKKQLSSLSMVKKGTVYAQRLLKLNPNYYDAYLTTGMTEYVIGSLPFFVRWFVKVENVGSNKEQGIKTVELVARQGKYLKPFAKILLAVANLREKRPRVAEGLLFELTRDYPENPLFKRELSQLSVKLQGPGQ